MTSWLTVESDRRRAAVDLRLVPAAAGSWACGLAAATGSRWPVWAFVAAGAVAIAAAWGIGRRTSARSRPLRGLVLPGPLSRGPSSPRPAPGSPRSSQSSARRRSARWSAGLVLMGVAVVCSGVVGALRQSQRLDSPLLRAAERGVLVTIEATLRTDPRLLSSGAGGSRRVLVELDVHRARVAGTTYTLDRPVVVLAAADGWVRLMPGQAVRVSGMATTALGGGDDAALSARGPPVVLTGPSSVQAAAGVVRSALSASAHRAVEPPSAGLLVALVDGDTSGVDPVVSAEFTAMGLTHLLAVSGANCAIVSGVVLWLARRLRLPFWAQIGLTGLALVVFVIVARPSPSVVRAAAMGAVTLLAFASGRPRAAVPALAGSVLVLLILQPALATSAGFALSVVATAGIVVLAPGWSDRWSTRMPRPLATALAVAAAAGVATAPVLVLLNPVLNLASIPANLLAAPAVPIATVLGVGAAVVAPWWPGAADLLCWVAAFAVRWIVLVAHQGSRLPEATVRWPAGLVGAAVLIAVIGLGCLAARVTRSRPGSRALVAGVVVGLVLVGVPVRAMIRGWPPAGWVLVMCDVGQGDALVVRAGPGAAIVIDTGPDPVAVDRCLRELGVTEVPLIVLSHLHQDHIGGLDGVLGRRPVGEIAASTLGAAPDVVGRLAARAASYGVPLRAPAVGEQRLAGGVVITVVGPIRAARNTRSDLNNNSLVLRLDVRGVSVLLTGDAEIEEQTQFLAEPGLLDVDVLKVPHHGSAYQRAEFLADATASVALVSVGAGNDYGHPSPLTMAELDQLGMTTYRTDLSGDVAVVVTDEGQLAIATRARGP